MLSTLSYIGKHLTLLTLVVDHEEIERPRRPTAQASAQFIGRIGGACVTAEAAVSAPAAGVLTGCDFRLYRRWLLFPPHRSCYLPGTLLQVLFVEVSRL